MERIWHTSFVVSKGIFPKITIISATKTQKKNKIDITKVQIQDAWLQLKFISKI